MIRLYDKMSIVEIIRMLNPIEVRPDNAFVPQILEIAILESVFASSANKIELAATILEISSPLS